MGLLLLRPQQGYPHQALKNKGIVNSECSRHMTGNKAYLADYQEINDEGNQTDKNAGPQDTNGNAGTQENVDARKEVSDQHYIVLPLWFSISSNFKSLNDKPKDDIGSKTIKEPVNKEDQAYRDELDKLISKKMRLVMQQMPLERSLNKDAWIKEELLKLAALTVLLLLVIQLMVPVLQELLVLVDHPLLILMHSFLLTHYYILIKMILKYLIWRKLLNLEVDFNNMESSTIVSSIPTHRVHIDHLKDQILGDPKSAVQTRGMAKKSSRVHAFMEPKKLAQAFDDESWVEAMQEELLQFSLQKVYVDDIIFGSTKKSLCDEFEALMHKRFQMSSMGELTFFLRLQVLVTPKLSHLHAVNQIFRYLKGQPRLGLWYHKDSPFDLEAYLDSDYGGSNLDRKFTTRGCQFLGRRLISWQCKKKTIVATSTTEAKYVAAVNEGSGSGLGGQETIGGAITQIRSEGALIQSINLHLSTGGHIPRSDEGNMTLKELTDLCTTLLQKVLDLENVKTAQTKEIASLKKRVTKLEQRHNSRISGFHPFKAGTSKRHSLGKRKVSKQERKNFKSQQMFQDIDDVLDEDADTEMIVKDKATLFDDEDVTIADTLEKKKDQDQIERDAEVALKIQAHLDEEARTEIERQEEASKAALAEMYDEVQAQINANHELVVRLTHEEQDKYTVKERSKLLAEFFKRTKKHLGKEREKDLKKMKKEFELESKEQQVQVQNISYLRSRRMLEVLDRQDMLDSHKIIMERFPANDPESYDLILWGDLKALVESKKRYPLTKEILKKMLSLRLEDEIESTLALELIKFIKLQIEENSGDLYPVTNLSSLPTAFVSTSSSIWHQRLRHPRDEVLQSLASRHFISCNKEKSTHACQLVDFNHFVCVTKILNDVNAPGHSRNSPKHVSFQTPRESVGSNDMVHNYYLENAKKKAQLQKDKALNKTSVQQSARLPNTANDIKPKPRNFNQQPRNWPPSMSSRVSNRTVNSQASTQKKDAQSHKTTKRYMPVEKKCDSKKHDRQIPIGQKLSPNKSSNVYLKTTPLRFGLTWKPVGRIFTQVGLKWIPNRKPVENRYNRNDSASPLGKETHNPKTINCVNSSSLSAVLQWLPNPSPQRVI
nr:putative ribonuclease H-like domain-containing protein [Tanacetum cinerariifolium]